MGDIATSKVRCYLNHLSLCLDISGRDVGERTVSNAVDWTALRTVDWGRVADITTSLTAVAEVP